MAPIGLIGVLVTWFYTLTQSKLQAEVDQVIVPVATKLVSFDWDKVYHNGYVQSKTFWTVEELNEIEEVDGGDYLISGMDELLEYIGWTSVASPWPTQATRQHLQESNYYKVVTYATKDNFVTDFNCSDTQLWDVLRNLAYVRAFYSSCEKHKREDECAAVYSKTSGFFIKPNVMVTVKHGVNDVQCYSEKQGTIVVQVSTNFDATCQKESDWKKYFLQASRARIGTTINSYDPEVMYEGREFLKEFQDLQRSQKLECEKEGSEHECSVEAQKEFEKSRNAFWGSFGIADMKSSPMLDMVHVTTQVDNHRLYEFTPWTCSAQDKILIIGHPSPVTGNIITHDGEIPQAEAKLYLQTGSASISRGNIILSECVDADLFSFESITWSGHSGGFIVLENDPKKLCGMVSTGVFNENKSIRFHIGICAKTIYAGY